MTEIRKLADLGEYQQLGATSPRGFVRACTGSGGQLTDLRIDPSALRLTAEELEAEVVTAITSAQNQYAKHALTAPVPGTCADEAALAQADEAALAQLEEGMARLDALATGLDRVARQRGLAR